MVAEATDDYPIRQAGLPDLPSLHRLIETAYRGDVARAGWTHEADLLGGGRIPLDVLAQMLGDPQQCILIASDRESILGCVQINRQNEERAYIGLLAVEPRLQGKGLGRRLLRAAERLAHDFGALHAEMMVIKQRGELIDYYQRQGYRITGEERPFPHDDPRFGLPKRQDLAFAVLEKGLGPPARRSRSAAASGTK
jgi:ribosomal protein S18 acetylase RimI-like enzyme